MKDADSMFPAFAACIAVACSCVGYVVGSNIDDAATLTDVQALELNATQRLERIEAQQSLILSAIRDGKVIVIKETRR